MSGSVSRTGVNMTDISILQTRLQRVGNEVVQLTNFRLTIMIDGGIIKHLSVKFSYYRIKKVSHPHCYHHLVEICH